MPIIKTAAMLFFSLLMFACQPEKAETAKQPSENGSGKLAIDAPAFAGDLLNGGFFSSKELEGKAFIVNFFASWCPPCRYEVPDMIELQEEYEQYGFTFIGITVDEDLSKAKAFVNSSGINYPVLVANQEILDAYSQLLQDGLRSIPTSFVIDKKGRIMTFFLGARNKAVFEALIQDALEIKEQ